jgi:hypothetical protein
MCSGLPLVACTRLPLGTVARAKPRLSHTSLACRWKVKEKTYTTETKDITDTGTKTENYEVLPLGNNVYSMDSVWFLACYSSRPSDITSDGCATHRFVPTAVGILCSRCGKTSVLCLIGPENKFPCRGGLRIHGLRM